MVFEKRNRLALAYDRFPEGIWTRRWCGILAGVCGIARCETPIEVLLDAEMLALRET